LVIDIIQSEKRSFFGFLSLYLLLCQVILAILSIIYYNSQEAVMLQKIRAKYANSTNEFVNKLKIVHRNLTDGTIWYPKSKEFESAIFDNKKNLIFSTFDTKPVDLDNNLYLKDGFVYLTKEPESYYLGAKYVVFRIKSSNEWLKEMILKKVLHV